MIPEYILINNLDFFLNVFSLNIIIGSITGIVFLTFFFTCTYENYQSTIQYVHEIIICIFFVLVSLIKTNLWNINSAFYINPIYSIGTLFVLIFTSIKLLQLVFNNIS